MGSIIKVDHLSYVYNPGMPNAVTALDDVSFEVEEGDFVGIIGATGSGKSTLITHMNGLNKPTSGKIYIDGRDLWADPEKIRDFRFLTGLVFQYPEYQLFEQNCYKDIAVVYSGDAAVVLDENEDMSFYMPSQGTNIWCDAMVIPQNAENPKLAHEFINYMLTYEAAFDNTETVGYTSPNAEVFEEMTSSEDLYADNAAYLPRSGYDKDEMFHDNQTLMRELSKLWIKVKAAK